MSGGRRTRRACRHADPAAADADPGRSDEIPAAAAAGARRGRRGRRRSRAGRAGDRPEAWIRRLSVRDGELPPAAEQRRAHLLFHDAAARLGDSLRPAGVRRVRSASALLVRKRAAARLGPGERARQESEDRRLSAGRRRQRRRQRCRVSRLRRLSGAHAGLAQSFDADDRRRAAPADRRQPRGHVAVRTMLPRALCQRA